MTTTQWLATCMGMAAAVAGIPSSAAGQQGRAPSTAPQRPNIVMILADDLAFSDLGCYGSEIATPNLDALAARGVICTQFYNQARCCPSRAVLLTGLYPHEAGIGAMIDDYAARQRQIANNPSYMDHLDPASPTVAELLRSGGYRTMMSGKWHMGRRPEEWPAKRGFDRSFAQINGAMNYYGGRSGDQRRDPMALDGEAFVPDREGFYSTDAFAAEAVEFIQESVTRHSAQPFFLYLPFNAPHWPLQAPEADIARYKGVYANGFQVVRETRFRKMTELGIVPAGLTMAPMDRGNAPPWNAMTDEIRADWERRMEIYAAQITRMDAAIGEVLKSLKGAGVEENTLVLFVSDNGGAAEDPNSGDKNTVLGTRDSYSGYARPWATVSNTPWRHHKKTPFEGGISTPFIAAWPQGIPQSRHGAQIREPAHLIDLVPTFLKLANVTYPTNAPHKLSGTNLLPLLRGEASPGERTFYWEHEGNRAIRKGKWKLVSLGSQAEWELYDIEADRVESRNLARDNPEVVRELRELWEIWAERCRVIPWPQSESGK